MEKLITEVKRLVNRILTPHTKKPRFTQLVFDVTVGSEKRHEATKLVRIHYGVIGVFAVKTGHVSTTKRYSSHTRSQNHLNCCLQFLEALLVVACPISAVLLRSKVKGSGEDERS